MKNRFIRLSALVTFLTLSVSVKAQYYQFAHFNETYNEFNDGEQLNVNQIFSQFLDTLVSDFPLNVLGESTSELSVGEFYVFWERPSENEATQLIPLFYKSVLNQASEISFKTVGTTGDRILKLQYKDIAFLDEPGTEYYTNFQIWFYEAEDKVEFRYGSRNIPSSGAYNEDGSGDTCPGAMILLVDIYNDEESSPLSAQIINTPQDPVYEQYFSSSNCGYQGMPNDGDVYQFYVSSAGIDEQESFSVKFSQETDYSIEVSSFGEQMKMVKLITMDGREIESMEGINASQVTIDLNHEKGSMVIVEIISESGKRVTKKIQL